MSCFYSKMLTAGGSRVAGARTIRNQIYLSGGDGMAVTGRRRLRRIGKRAMRFPRLAGGLPAQRCGIGFKMSEARNLFAVLRQSADLGAATAIEELIRDAPDRALCRINVVDFAANAGLDEEEAIAAFLHAARLGIFELSGNVLCPSCAGVLDASATLKRVNREE